MTRLSENLIFIRGGGDLATGVVHRLRQAGFQVLVAELPQPLCVRRAVAVAEAVYAGQVTVEGLTARLVADPLAGVAPGEVPVIVDPDGAAIRRLRPAVVVDARMAKRPLDTRLTDAPLVIALGPGFRAGRDCHAVVETQRGHHLGRVYWQGEAASDSGQPEPVRGLSPERVLRAPRAGVFQAVKQIGDPVRAEEVVGEVAGAPVIARCDGVLRGILHDGLTVSAGLKIGDIDPRGVREYCFSISDKARAIGGGVLEAVLAGRRLFADPSSLAFQP